MYFLCYSIIFFIFCVNYVSIVKLHLVMNDYYLCGINICIGNTQVCNTVIISFYESGLTISNRFHYAFNQSKTAEFIEERDTSFILADEVSLLQNSNSNIGSTISIKNFKFTYSENSYGIGAGCLGLNYNEKDTNILYRLFSIINEKKVFYLDIKKSLLVIGGIPYTVL